LITIDSPFGDRVLPCDAIELILCKLGALLCGFGMAILGTVEGKREKACTVDVAMVTDCSAVLEVNANSYADVGQPTSEDNRRKGIWMTRGEKRKEKRHSDQKDDEVN
jgi:hypothetical protein